ncbi:hypothetical protein JKF63_04066 [Porcisia hertigi]|uniref:Anaphase-promoting complex subunit 5 domain-containing protein n=1 Tax=Porcisia hertigi TaxID=2761500 RepID=A0A836IAZ3_9TRYP|nr:hypothetical protein JKF63_04066 [Porcisia hertigi]
MFVKTVRTTKGLVEAAKTCLAESTFAPDKAADLLQTAIQQDPTYVNALLLQSTLSSRLGHLTSALADISLAIELDKGNSDPHRLASLYGGRANLCYRLGRYSDAATDLRSALRWEPDNGMWCYELGRVYMKQGNVSLAQWYFQQTLQEPMWSRVNEMTRPKVYALYGRSCLISREYKKSKMLLDTCIKEGMEGSAAVLHNLGLAHYFEGTSFPTAVEYLTRAVELDTRSVDYIMDLSLALVRCNQYNEALSSMNEAVLRGHEDVRLRFYRGCIELELGMGPQALVDLQVPTSMGHSRHSKGGALLKQTAVRACLAMGLVHIFCDKDLSAGAAALEAEALKQTQELSIRLYTELLLGIVYHRVGDRHAALRALHEALRVLREIACARSGDGKEPGSHVSHLPLCITDAATLTLTHLGLVYSDLGYADLAARHFREVRLRATEQNCDAAQADVCCFRLAVSQVEMNDHLGALQTLRTRPLSKHRRSVSAANPPSPPPADPSKGKAYSAEVTELGNPSDESAAGRAELKKETASPIGASLLGHHLPQCEMEHLHAVILRRLGRLDQALSYATAAIEATGPLQGGATVSKSSTTRPAVPAFLYNRALIFFSLARYPEALADVQECIRACGKHDRTGALRAEVADPYYLQGRIHHSLGAYTEALESLTEALRLNPSLQLTPSFSYAHGVLFAIAGRLDDALAAFTAAISAHNEASRPDATTVEPDQEQQRVSRKSECAPLVYYQERAKVYQQLGNYENALKDFEVVLGCTSGTLLPVPFVSPTSTVMRPSTWSALVNRALTLKELKRYTEAAIDWDAALRSDRSGLLASFTSQDVFELPYLHLCLPGEEVAGEAGGSSL